VRGAFLVLVATNIVFFAWAQWIDVPARAPVAVDRDAGIPPLQLVLNGNAATSPPAAATAPMGSSTSVTAPSAGHAAPVTPNSSTPAGAGSAAPEMTAESAPSTRCRSLGPFDDVNAANAAADRLRTRGMNPHDRSADTVNPNVYWVYIGELTVEMQRRAIQTLNSAGIHDAVSMIQPEQSDRVSVGVFADQAHAVRRAEQVRALGLKPTLGMRQRTVTAHWIDFELKPAEMEPSLTELTGPVVRGGIGLGPVRFSDCLASGGNG
jgi:cell division septation protein DedD